MDALSLIFVVGSRLSKFCTLIFKILQILQFFRLILASSILTPSNVSCIFRPISSALSQLIAPSPIKPLDKLFKRCSSSSNGFEHQTNLQEFEDLSYLSRFGYNLCQHATQ